MHIILSVVDRLHGREYRVVSEWPETRKKSMNLRV